MKTHAELAREHTAKEVDWLELCGFRVQRHAVEAMENRMRLALDAAFTRGAEEMRERSANTVAEIRDADLKRMVSDPDNLLLRVITALREETIKAIRALPLEEK